MREILFRGKSEFTRKWLYGDLRTYPTRGTEAIFSHELSCRSDVIPSTVGQFTGLTDMNGKKIFEGDILQFDYIGKNRGVNGIAGVSFQNGKFGVEWGWHKEFVCLDGFANTTLKVIGNIHDNPELLRGTEDGK